MIEDLDDLKFWYQATDWIHPSRTWRKIRNVIRWIPVLWRDADWDYSSLYTIMATKLEHMAAHQRSHDNHEESAKLAGQMSDTAKALRRLISADYLPEDWEIYWKRYPLPPCSEWERTEDGCAIMPSMSDGQRGVFRDICGREAGLMKDDLDFVAKQFAENSQGWWD